MISLVDKKMVFHKEIKGKLVRYGFLIAWETFGVLCSPRPRGIWKGFTVCLRVYHLHSTQLIYDTASQELAKGLRGW